MNKEIPILAHLQSGKSLTSLQALQRFGTTRLAVYIHRLRRKGWPIHMERVQGAEPRTRYGKYRLDFDKRMWPK